MKCDVLNAGRKAREAADLSGDSKEGVDGIRGATLENIETRTNPFALVFHGLKKISVVPVITYQTNKKPGRPRSMYISRNNCLRLTRFFSHIQQLFSMELHFPLQLDSKKAKSTRPIPSIWTRKELKYGFLCRLRSR